MGHSVGDAAARSVKKSEKAAAVAARTPEQRIKDIRNLASSLNAVHNADILFLLGEYDRLKEVVDAGLGKIAEELGKRAGEAPGGNLPETVNTRMIDADLPPAKLVED